MYGTLAKRSTLNPLGLMTRSHSWFTPFSQVPCVGSPNRSLGGRCVLPSSTKGRKGITTASTRRPEPGRSMARSCASKVKGVSQRSSTLSSAMASNPSGCTCTPSALAASSTPSTSYAPTTHWNPLAFRRLTMGGLASVATTALKPPPSRSFSVTSPSPAPTSSSTRPLLPSARCPSMRSVACSCDSTCMRPRPSIALASVRLIYLRR
mmetsp:Transcript_12470/g.30109  ORF Transcript_12470/g.30109 Transcript_12470/m.30109 type:complete len:208 (+) Transcript_12470:233-856(+)